MSLLPLHSSDSALTEANLSNRGYRNPLQSFTGWFLVLFDLFVLRVTDILVHCNVLGGVSRLSTVEVNNDLRDLYRSLLLSKQCNVSDDDSVHSDEVLTSNYPVKPRKFAKVQLRYF